MAKSNINWLLLRGLTREKSHWGAFLPALKKNFPNSQVFCLDHPGAGTENLRASPMSIAAITDDLRERWRKSFSKSKLGDWVCVGHSLGGMVALDWQERYSKDFIGAVTINSSARGIVPIWKRAKFGALKDFARIALERDVAKREALVLGITSNLEKNNPKILQEWVEFAKARPLYPRTELRQFAAAGLFKARFPARVPLFILYSEADRLADPSCSKELAKRYQMDSRAHLKAGHDIALDDADWLVECLLDFSEKLKK